MELPYDGTLCQRMISQDRYMGIMWVHRAQGQEIKALWLQDMYIHLGFSLEAAKLLMREQGLDHPERLIFLTDRMLMMSSSISPRGTTGGHIMPSPPGC